MGSAFRHARVSPISRELIRYKRRFFFGRVLRALGYWLALQGLLASIWGLLEGSWWLSSDARAGLLYGSLVLSGIGALYVLRQGIRYVRAKRLLSDAAVAAKVATQHPTIQDQLTNYLELRASRSDGADALIEASLAQRLKRLRNMPFAQLIPLKVPRQTFITSFIVVLIMGLVWSLWPAWQAATQRVLAPNQVYQRPSPFTFTLKQPIGRVFLHEPLTITATVSGPYLPKDMYLLIKNTRLRVSVSKAGALRYHIPYVREAFAFQWEADGHLSPLYLCRVAHRAQLLATTWHIQYPRYTHQRYQNETLNQLRAMEVPEGTRIHWQLRAQHTDAIELNIKRPKKADNERLSFSKTQHKDLFALHTDHTRSGEYTLKLRNQAGASKALWRYPIAVRKDRPPRIHLKIFEDTLLHRLIALAGYADDDYGIRHLKLLYTHQDPHQSAAMPTLGAGAVRLKSALRASPLTEGTPALPKRQGARPPKRAGPSKGGGSPHQGRGFSTGGRLKAIAVPFTRRGGLAHFDYTWVVDSLVSLHRPLYYALAAWDNNGVRGSQRTRTPWRVFALPARGTLYARAEAEARDFQKALSRGLRTQSALNASLEVLADRLKTQTKTGFEDRQHLKGIEALRRRLAKEAAAWREAAFTLSEQLRRLAPEDADARLRMRDIQQRLDENPLNEDLKTLYEALNALIEKKGALSAIQKLLDEIQHKEGLLRSDYARSWRQMGLLKSELASFAAQSSLASLRASQDSLRAGVSASAPEALPSKAPTQKGLQRKMQALSKQIAKWRSLHLKEGEGPAQKRSFPPTRGEESLIKAAQKRSEQALTQSRKADALKAQKQVLDGLKRLSRQLKGFESGQQVKQLDIEIAEIHRLLNNLIRLSEAQEVLEADLSPLESEGPQFARHTEAQLDLQSGAQATLDSLAAFGERSLNVLPDFFKDLQKLGDHFKRIRLELNERKPRRVKVEERLAMTQLNRLALTLGRILDHLRTKRRRLAHGKGGGKSGQSQQKPSTSMSEAQQKLNQKIGALQRSGKQGRALSQALAQLMAEQELLRRKLEALHRERSFSPAMRAQQKALVEAMKQNERQLAEKKLNEALMSRTKRIQTRLLELEGAEKQDDRLSKKREARFARYYEKHRPADWMKTETDPTFQEKEAIQRQTLPLKPYYEAEALRYFERLHEAQSP